MTIPLRISISVEIADHGEYHFRNFHEKLSAVAEKHPQGFREGEDELSMRKTQQDLPDIPCFYLI